MTMDHVSQIRQKIDIVSFISEYIPLKKLGRNFKANCPFHNEKTPSFVVSPERQIWHCFGCGKGGDCFTFLIEYEKLEFPEALRILAKKTGVELKEYKGQKEAFSKKEIIYQLNKKTMEYYNYILLNLPAGKKALDYLIQQRKIKPEVIKTFMLGFAPASGSALTDYLISKKGYNKENLIDAGLVNFRNGKISDFFVNRLIFPLFDHRDNVIGFSGRILVASSEISKYVNTRETLVYHKGDVFFGLNIAKDRIKKEEFAIIMEGEFDVISSFEEGISNAVAVKGTALTENQVNLISRFAPRVALCFDGDKAGEAAIKRSLPALEKKGLTTNIVVISNGKDPDESIKNDPYGFKNAIKDQINVYDYLIFKVLQTYDIKTADGKKKIGDEILPLISNIENEIVKEHYLKKLANELEISLESITKQLQKAKQRVYTAPILSHQKSQKDRKEVLEEYLISLLVQLENPKEILSLIKEKLNESMFGILSLGKIWNHLLDFNKYETVNDKKFVEFLPAELLPTFDICFLSPLPKFTTKEEYKNEIVKSAEELRLLYIKNRIKEIGSEIKNKEKEGKLEELEELQEQFKSLTLMLQE